MPPRLDPNVTQVTTVIGAPRLRVGAATVVPIYGNSSNEGRINPTATKS